MARPAIIPGAAGARENGTHGYLRSASSARIMQDISFAIGRFLEATFSILTVLGWLPVIAFSVIMFFGMLYWLNLQGRYNAKAKREGTLA